MSKTFKWCKNKIKLAIFGKQVMIVNIFETKWWYLNGKRHREDGPAVEYDDGRKWWYLNGQLHREDGPAVEYPNGVKEWWLNGQLHREDGPAIEYGNGDKAWWLNGKHYIEPEYWKEMKK